MTTRARFAVALAVLGLVLSGCGGSGGSSDSTSTTSDVKPADGDIQKTADFSYVAPKNWQKPKSPVSGPVSFVGDAADHDGFTDNLNVIRIDPAPSTDIDALEKAGEKELKAAHAANVKVLDQQKIDGDKAIHLTSGFSQNGVKYLVDQFSVVHKKVAYVVTFSFSNDVPAKRQDSLAQSVLTTWKWAA